MRWNDISIRSQLMMICILLIIVPIITLGLISYNETKSTLDHQIEENLLTQQRMIADNIRQLREEKELQLENAVKISYYTFFGEKHALLSSEKVSLSLTNQANTVSSTYSIPVFMRDNEPISLLNSELDELSKNTGLQFSIMQLESFGLIRTATTVKNGEVRAVNTYIPSDSAVYKSIASAKPYKGTAVVLGKEHLVYYLPILDSNNKVIGALFGGIPLSEIQESTLDLLSRNVIGKTGYIFILDSEGNYVLSQKRARDGENLIASKDATGKLFIAEMISLAKEAKGESVEYTYFWLRDNALQQKIAIVSYDEKYDWIIGPSAYYDDYYDSLYKLRNETIIISLVSFIIGVIVSYYIAKSLTSNFMSIINPMKEVSAGNLTINLLLVKGKNELGVLAESFNSMVIAWRGLVSSIRNNAQNAAATAEELSATTQTVNAVTRQVTNAVSDVAKGGQKLSANAVQTTSHTQSLIASIHTVAEFAQVSAKNALEANDAAATGSQAAKNASSRMKDIERSVSTSADMVDLLGQKSKQITQIVEVINGISAQTNLLALNAAIEAARAGEAGRGFAVVADEVRKLAEESQKATQQIQDMILEITTQTQKAVESMKNGRSAVSEGSQVVNDALTSLELIKTKVQAVANQAQEISASTQEQLAASMNVQKSVEDVSAVAAKSSQATESVTASVEETSASIDQVALAAQSLATSATDLQKLVEKFKV